MLRAGLRRALRAAGLILLGALALVVLNPFESSVAIRRAVLAAAGVRRVARAGTLVYERSNCVVGEPCRCVALVHGLGDSALTWDKVLLDRRGSEPGTRLDAVDLPGTDGAPVPASAAGYSIPGKAAALEAALAPVCPRWTIVANSLGGWSSLTLALKRPDLVDRLILLSPAGVEDPSGRAEESARTLADPTVDKLKVFSGRARFRDREVPESVWEPVLRSIVGRHTRDTVLALRREDLLDARLGALKAPTVLLWGEADGIIPPTVGERMSRLIPGARLEVLPKCGHLPQQECPESVLRELYDPMPRRPS